MNPDGRRETAAPVVLHRISEKGSNHLNRILTMTIPTGPSQKRIISR